MADTPQKQDQPTQSQQKQAPKVDNPYQFTDDERAQLGDGFDYGHPIARAWSRSNRDNHYLGAPVGGMRTQLNVTQQAFQNAVAMMRTDDNPNQVVQFYDARGLVDEQSGL